MSLSSAPRVFVSYSRADKKWLGRLQTHLKPLVREGRVDLWDDTRINTGDKWRDEIMSAIASARVAVLLISADFLASDFIGTVELPEILSKRESKKIRVMQLIISDCRFLEHPQLGQFQVLNPIKPLAELSWPARERIWKKLAEEIIQTLTQESSSGSILDTVWTQREEIAATHRGALVDTGKAELVITVVGNLEDFSEENKARLLRVIGAVIREGVELKIKGISHGSIRVRVELPWEDAEQLNRAITSGQLKVHGVFRSQWSARALLLSLAGVGRREQEAAFRRAIYEAWQSKPNKPFICIVPGAGENSPQEFVEFLIRKDIVPTSGVNTPVRRFFVDWPELMTGSYLEEHGWRIIQALNSPEVFNRNFQGVREQLVRHIGIYRMPLILEYRLELGLWWKKGLKSLDEWLGFWEMVSNSPDNLPVFVFLIITYKPNSSVRALHRFNWRILRKQLYSRTFERYKHFSVTVLPELTGVTLSHAMNWANYYGNQGDAKEDAELHKHIHRLFEESATVSSKTFIRHMLGLLHRRIGSEHLPL